MALGRWRRAKGDFASCPAGSLAWEPKEGTKGPQACDWKQVINKMRLETQDDGWSRGHIKSQML